MSSFGERTSRSELYEQYIVQGISVNRLAKHYNTTGTTIRKALLYHNIQMRPNGKALKKPDSHKRNRISHKLRPTGTSDTLTKDVLHDLYIIQDKSAVTIAAECGVNSTVIYHLLKFYSIEKDKQVFYEIIGHDKLYDLYTIQGKSTTEIALQYAVDVQKVAYALSYYNVPINDRSVYAKLQFVERYPHLTVDMFDNLKSLEWWTNELTQDAPTEIGIKYGIDYPTVISYINNVGLTAGQFGWNSTWAEREVGRWLTEWNIAFVKNDRSIIAPKELDFYIPTHNLAIELNGEFWHSEANDRIDNDYHKNKTLLCHQYGITLFQFWDMDLKNEGTCAILKSKLKNALKLSSDKVFARKTKLVILTPSEYQPFYVANHIQGCKQYYKYNYGLVYNDKLMAAISFNETPHGLYLARFATDITTNVVGGFSKLLSHAIKTLTPKQIETFSNGQYHKASGNVYSNTGFTKHHWTAPNYVYYKNHSIVSRQQAQRSKLSTLLGDSFDPKLSEHENMRQAGWSRLYDCGHVKYTLTL